MKPEPSVFKLCFVTYVTLRLHQAFHSLSLSLSCWLSLTNGAIWAFVAPAMFVIVVRTLEEIVSVDGEVSVLSVSIPLAGFQVNVGILILVTRIISRIGGESYKVHGDTNAVKWVFWPNSTKFSLKVKKVRALLLWRVPRLTAKAVAVLLPILGISWIFGILAVNTHSLVFLYVFAVFNSLQVGLYVPEMFSAKSASALWSKTIFCWTFLGFLCLLVSLPPQLWGMLQNLAHICSLVFVC